jgi:uncharacterized membrane protein SpoIIM required for sporulation
MKEITFLRQNYQRWMEFENLLNAGDYGDPDALADLFVRITDDLSWARTFYPGSNTEKYLNDLAARIHQEIYKNKKEKRSRIMTFWTREFPLMFKTQHINLLIAFVIFGISVWIGAISAQNDESFVRLILGDSYVDMTLENMKGGDPMGVYKDENQFMMFFYLAVNNSVVALLCIMAGVLHWLGVGVALFRNGVMLGAFFYFLTANGYSYEAFHTVWIHGVIEIWCIVVAGAGGIALGNALWFPGAWPRGEAFMRGARSAMKVALGLIPFFFLAAFFEGFVTRYTELNDLVRKFIIYGSLVFVVWYFVIFPYVLSMRGKAKNAASAVHTKFTLVLLWIAIILCAPFGPVILAIIRVTHKGHQMSALELLTKVKEINPLTMSRVLFGMLLLFLPTIAAVGAAVKGEWPDIVSVFFFAFCNLCGLGMIVWAAYMVNRYEENDLSIERSSKVHDTHYESKGTSIKV